MSLFNTLREAGRRETVEVTLYLENGTILETGKWPGNRLRNLNDFILELDIVAKGENIKKIDIDGFIVSFE
jgi:hypothetical protein